MNASKTSLIIGIPGAVIAISTIYDSAQTNPILNLEIIIPLWGIILSLAGSFGLGVLVLYLRHHRKRIGYSIISTGSTPLGRQLRDKYGEGFTDDDELIIEAINKDNESAEDIAIFTDLSVKHIKERINFMEVKGVDEITFYSD